MIKKEIKKIIPKRISKEQIMELYNIAKERYPDEINDISVNPISWSLFIDGTGEIEFKQNQDIYNYLRRFLIMTKKEIKKVLSDWAKRRLRFGNKIAYLVLREHRIQIHSSSK